MEVNGVVHIAVVTDDIFQTCLIYLNFRMAHANDCAVNCNYHFSSHLVWAAQY
jgi:hypothetical protein